MKAKILESLKTKYKTLGLDETAFDRVAVLGETIITDESQIATFVEGAKWILIAEQSSADKVRTAKTEYEKAIAEKEAEITKLKTPPATGTPPVETPPADAATAAILAELKAIREEGTTLRGELDAIKQGKTIEQTLVGTKTKFMATDWAKTHSDIAERAWKNAEKFYNVGGQKMTQDELFEEAKISFDDYASARGIEKPFEGDKGGGKQAIDFSEDAKILENKGLIATEKKE